MKLKLTDVKVGDVLVPDGGFPCLVPKVPVTVGAYSAGLYVACKDGFHFLEGQVDEDGYLVGFERHA